MASSSQAPDWLRLQRKIFSRWVNQKLSLTRGIHCNDVVTELGDGFLLMNLVEVLSEKQCNEKLTKNAKLRVHKLDNLNHVLNFVWSSGIQMKIKPSSENLVDGDEKACLGLIWAIMLKFLRFGDDDEDGQESLNAKDSLLMWVQNQVANYSLEVKNFGKNFHDGKILCAIIHKHRPKLINWETVTASSGPSNLQLAMDAATQYFGLEQYLSTDDILKLDENSMVVYVSEYYHGIAEQRKMDLAARRIQKVITFTIENDALRAEFNSTSAQLVQNLTRVEAVLNDRTIDNTLAGAKRKLEEFYDFKKNDKSVILADQLNLESLYNNLAMRLSHHKRPEFIPAPGCSLKDLEARVKQLEQVEHERKVALHAELNRQLRLVNINEQHETRYNKLVAWLGEKKAYTAFEENIDSVGTAQFQLKVLDAFFQENQQVRDTIVSYLTKQGAELLAEKYEHSDRVQAREQEIAEGLSVISSQAANKKQVLDAALALEIRKEELRQQFADLAANFSRWAQASADNLERFFGYTLEEVESFDAKLSALDAELSATAVAKHDEAVAVFEEGRSIGVRENRYSSLSPADLAASRDSLLRAIADRRGEYDRELQRQKRNDALSKQFSQLADPFSQSISEFKDSITNSKAPLEEQLAQVQSRIASHSSQELDAIKDLQAQLDAAGVTNNKYTLLTAKDCEAQWEQYSVFLQRKAAMLEKEIEHVRLRGVTPEQYREIEENFRSFDKDSDGAISRRELKALLYSLGEEKNRSEVNAITTEFGNNDGPGRVEYEGFKEFMIRLLGDTDTKEEIEAGFFLINRGADFATKEKLSFVMEDSAVDYFVQTAPQIPEGYNYKGWTADVFSR